MAIIESFSDNLKFFHLNKGETVIIKYLRKENCRCMIEKKVS